MQLIITDVSLAESKPIQLTPSTLFLINFIEATYFCHGGGLLVPLGIFERCTERLASCWGACCNWSSRMSSRNVMVAYAKIKMSLLFRLAKCRSESCSWNF